MVAMRYGGSGVNPDNTATGVQGSAGGQATTTRVVTNRGPDGRPPSAGPCLRTTGTICAADATDSLNRPVRTCAGPAISRSVRRLAMVPAHFPSAGGVTVRKVLGAGIQPAFAATLLRRGPTLWLPTVPDLCRQRRETHGRPA